MGRKGMPDDYVVDVDRGSGTVRAKQALVRDGEEARERAVDRAGLRDLDAMVERTPGLTRLQRDVERATPRNRTADLAHPRMERQLPGMSDTRAPISDRQKKARSKARLEAQATMPLTQLGAQYDAVSRPERWKHLNDQLSASAGDAQALPEDDQAQVRRIDRSIQAYEQANDRGHVVYVPVELPHYINSSNQDGYVKNNFEPAGQAAFDRYTVGAHQLHEAAQMAGNGSGMMFLEVQTRRGAYLGQSDKKDNTRHLLPRSMDIEYLAAGRVSFTDPQGRRHSAMVVQARDTTPDI